MGENVSPNQEHVVDDTVISKSSMPKGKQLSYKEKSSIHFVGQDDPPFIKKLKQQVGYKAPATIKDKFASTPADGYLEDREEDDLSTVKEEDRPQIVVLDEKNDMNEKQVAEELQKKQNEKDRQLILESKIIFKKPQKRQATEDAETVAEKKCRNANAEKPSPNSRLLSFGDEEDDT
uniref:DUF4604 domain-containing protein n=1 Tax=Ascaris lumbricoides TaxID=6252 RepID=A0A9J2P0M6_ASCLU